MVKSVLFIGNRCNCFKILDNNPNYSLSKVFALKDSFLHNYLVLSKKPHRVFELAEKDEIIDELFERPFDVLVSNGCPFLLPASRLKEVSRILINIHPTYLPHLRGKSPLNGVFYQNYDFIGATAHFIEDGVDSGNIIYQEKITLTPDIDQGLVYYISFELEGIVFKRALEILEKNDFTCLGKKMNLHEGSMFNRTNEKQTVDLNIHSTDLCVKKIKSFGITSQGCFLTLGDKRLRIFDAEKILSPFLLKSFASSEIGKIVLGYDEKIIVKTLDGLLKIISFEEL
ncbi:MAG TPA: formyltransferase family protein [Candidatus Rifleibacterium sp.]|nr:formyltransferase family protein [Candidatus Rifleibacterium sp.]